MIFVKLLIAHLVGDFFTQTKASIEQKEEKKWTAPFLYLHTFIHFLLVLAVLWDFSVWKEALFIACSHFLIDGLKLTFHTKKSKRIWFYIDQLLHILVLIAAWIWFFGGNFAFVWEDYMWMIAAGFLLLTNPVGYTIQAIMSRWTGELNDNEGESLTDAGKVIGVVERVFIYISILNGFPQAIGFLITAKSVFRFGDLNRAKNRKLTEYILIGTLISFLMAIGVGISVQQLV